jgi:hypothetical protein
MRKTYQMFLALALMMLGAMNVSAEEISLKDVPFWDHPKTGGVWGLNAPKDTQVEPAWVLGEPTGLPYGDSNVLAFADLSAFEKLVITYSEGTPRVLMNRDVDEGSYDATEANSHLLEWPKSGWTDKYFTDKELEDGTKQLTVDLKKIVNEKGYAYLHAIKGANWADVTVLDMVLVRKGKDKQVGWVNIVTNGDLEGDDTSSFVYALHANSNDGNVTYPAVIEDGVGVGGSRGLAIKSDADAAETWSTQLFIVLPEVLPAGTQWRFSMDAISSPDAELGTGCHADPRNWKDGGGALSSDFSTNPRTTSEWSTITAKGTISEDLFGKGFQSLCFDLNQDKTTATQYYFDNIKFEIYKYGTVAEYKDDNLQIDFGFETNLPELCKAAGKKRIQFPKENAKVLVNGQEIGITSVEGFDDGRFYIFLDEAVSESDEVHVTYNNAAGDLQLKYAGGPNAGEAIPSVDEIAEYNDYLLDGVPDDVYPYTMLAPTIVSAYPEQGSFNIPASLKEFKVKFDKNADASQIVAKLDGKALTVEPATGMVEEIVLKYGGADLTNGLHTINITKIYPEEMLSEEIFTDTTYVFSVGASDPNDVAYDLIPVSYFNDCAAGSVPEGFILYADGDPAEARVPGNSYGSGARMMEFGANGDFTKGLYMRTWYLTYGANDDTHVLSMTAGKKYNISFNSCQWAGSGHYMKFQIMNGEEEVFSQVVENSPNVQEKRDPVKGSTFTSIDFIPEADGNYVMNWIVATNAEGTPTENAWQNGVILANVKVSYVPSAFGVVEIMELNEALEKAKNTQANNAGERYDGEAQTALNEAIAKVEAEKDGYTSPSQCNDARDLLNGCSDKLIAHVDLCNSYDNAIKTGSATVDQNKETKFKDTELYAQLVALVDKYHGKSSMVNVAEEGAEPKWERQYEFDVLKDDAALTTAIAELTETVNTTAKLFTTGQSQFTTTGVAALVERLRLGAETLKALGRAEDSYPVAQALNALDDDDELAEEVKNHVKAELYAKLKDNENIFEKIDNSDPENPEVKTVSIDMTVFVKNPNLYAREYTQEVTGWEKISGNAQAWSSWNGNDSHSNKTAYVEDCKLHPGWHAVAAVEQTITDLPAGVYTINFVGDDNSTTSDGTYAYVKTSETPAVEEGAEVNMDVNYAGYALMTNQHINDAITDIVVTDGILTLGYAWGGNSQAFFDEVHVLMTAPANVDYAALYTEAAAAGIETLEGTPAAKVRAIQLFDINGRRVVKAQKGINIVKKVMSDGSIKTEKVIVK